MKKVQERHDVLRQDRAVLSLADKAHATLLSGVRIDGYILNSVHERYILSSFPPYFGNEFRIVEQIHAESFFRSRSSFES